MEMNKRLAAKDFSPELLQLYDFYADGRISKRAAVLVVHENRGLNPYIEDVARRLAKAGFLALAPDGLTSVGGGTGLGADGGFLQENPCPGRGPNARSANCQRSQSGKARFPTGFRADPRYAKADTSDAPPASAAAHVPIYAPSD